MKIQAGLFAFTVALFFTLGEKFNELLLFATRVSL